MFLEMMKPWQTSLNEAPNKQRRKGRKKEIKLKSETKVQKPKGSHTQKSQGTNYVSKPSPIERSISKKEMERKF
jgi:hypothetical protein